MTATLGFTGMDPSTEAELRQMFEQELPRLAHAWRVVAVEDADTVVIDLDTRYGPMSLLTLGSRGKRIVALSSGGDGGADHLLARPLAGHALRALLDRIGNDRGSPQAGAAIHADDDAQDTRQPPTGATAAAHEAAMREEAIPTMDASASMPDASQTDIASAMASSMETTDDAPVADTPRDATIRPDTSDTPDGAEAPKADASNLEPPSPEQPQATPWYVPGSRRGRWGLSSAGQVLALLDYDQALYHGPDGLKALQPAFEAAAANIDHAMTPLDDESWSAQVAGMGQAQPLPRLHWYGALLAGNGALHPDLDPHGQYRLLKWPRTEREFPRHFRIATAMMRGSATVADIAAAADVEPAEVADFVNAHLASGHAQAVAEEPAAMEAPRGGLLSRIRRR